MNDFNQLLETYARQFPDSFLYSSHPGDGQHRYVFQNHVAPSKQKALEYMMLRMRPDRIDTGVMDR